MQTGVPLYGTKKCSINIKSGRTDRMGFREEDVSMEAVEHMDVLSEMKNPLARPHRSRHATNAL
jgi:hypothetical protein